MRFLYTNLADSVHFNSSATYISPYVLSSYHLESKPDGTTTHIRYASQRMKQLKSEMKKVLESSDCILYFTLNQVADNPVFYMSSPESKELFTLLVELLKRKKAFISTFNGNNASNYELNNIISSWKRICDDQTDELRFVSSLIEELSNIRGDEDPDNEMIVHYSDRVKRNAHKAVFGFDRLVTISGENVIWHTRNKGNDNIHSLSLDDYLKKMIQYSKEMGKYGYYTGLKCGKGDEACIGTQCFMKRIQHIDEIMGCYSNDLFVKENNITLSTVINEIIQTDIMEKLYIETIDSALEKRIRDKKQQFLDAARNAFTEIAKRANRSQMYEAAFKAIKEHLINLMEYADTSGHRNPGYTLILSFFFQVIDFCYNYFNCLQCFGVRDNVGFHFYPYYSRNLTRSNNYGNHVITQFEKQRKSIIILSNNLFKKKIMYTIEDGNKKCVGSYLNFANARTALKEKINTPGGEYQIVDKQGSIISM